MKVGMISLGCTKNLVDSETALGLFKEAGYTFTEDPAQADILMVNTCGFIESAKKESIEEILELAQLKKEGKIKKLVVTGCLGERYQAEMHKELPELDAVIGIGANGDIAQLLTQMMEEDQYVESFPDKSNMPLCGERVLTTPSYFAYVKIAEGCDNRCSYCAIPLIRGGYRSRTMESIEEECRALVADGAKELILIAQDTSRYGIDLYGEYSLAKLMRRLCAIEGLRWLRVLYCYPDSITDELLETMAGEEKIVPYIDLPLQHASGKVLRAMNRRGDRQSLTALMERIREKGVVFAPVTLHVGLGTFRPVKEERVEDHHMHSEYYMVTPEAADRLNAARQRGGRIVCVGTTSVRTLETVATEDGTWDYANEVVYPFGYGLSYTAFQYGDLNVKKLGETDYYVSFSVKNVGRHVASEIVQVYIADDASMVTRPRKELVAFGKKHLEVGETCTFGFNLTERDFAYFSPVLNEFYVENGTFTILIGASSADIRLQEKVEIKLPDEKQFSQY